MQKLKWQQIWCGSSSAGRTKAAPQFLQRRQAWVALLLCLLALFVCGLFVVQPMPRSAGSIQHYLFQPSYCSAPPPTWISNSSSNNATTRPKPTSTAVVAAFMAVHEAARRDTAAAAAAMAAAGATSSAHERPQQWNMMASLQGAAGSSYPPGSSDGRGIVIVGGGPKYTPPAYACVVFLRRVGCRLPVEVWRRHTSPSHQQLQLILKHRATSHCAA